MNDLVEKINQWVIDRNLHTQDPRIQLCKTMEELGELVQAILKSKDAEAKDGVGDIVVTLICLCAQKGWDFEECVALAYDEIKDRKGRLVDGVFVKEKDPRIE